MKIIFLILASLTSLAIANTKPNIVLILTDDQGYGAMSAHGHPYINTPNMDQFYKESVRFDNFYVSPSCSPSRGALLTGRHEFEVGITHTSVERQKLCKTAITLPEILKTAGYVNGMFGKWHLGGGAGYKPDDRGFDITSLPIDIHNGLFDKTFVRNGKRVQTTGFREDRIFDHAIEFIEENKENPFFCYLATYSPHTPLDAPQAYLDRYDAYPELLKHPNSDKHIKYMAMVDNLDWNIGRVLQKLEDEKLTENTIIIMMSDNGETWGLDVYNANMRGPKGSIWHGGSRAISMWKFGKKWQPKTSPRLTAHLDVIKTLADYTDVKLAPAHKEKIDGYSLKKLLESTLDEEKNVTEPPADRFLYQHVARWADVSEENASNKEAISGFINQHKHTASGIRQGDYLMVQSFGCNHPECIGKTSGQCERLRRIAKGTKTHTYTTDAQFHWAVTEGWELYDTRKDPGCNANLAPNNPELVSKFSNAYDSWWTGIEKEVKHYFQAAQ